MSVSNLLDPLTLNQEWSKLYCNELNALELNIPGTSIGSVVQTEIFPQGNWTMLLGTRGSTTAWSIQEKTGTLVKCNTSLNLGSVSGIWDGTASTIVVSVQLDATLAVAYPPSLSQQMGGACVEIADGNAVYPCTIKANMVQGSNSVNWVIQTPNDISVPSATRVLSLSANFAYLSTT